jgi:phosphate transport system substrate-binding protein
VISTKWLAAAGVVAAMAIGVAACGGDDDNDEGAAASDLSGTIRIDGSSTVGPLSEAAAELFMEQNPDVNVTVGTSGTGGGFEKFCRGETDGSDASREIKEEEIELCEQNGIAYESVQVANDGLAVAVNPENDWATCITVDELNAMWDRGSDAETWSDVNPDWPDEQLELYGPGTDSGTFDYFTEAINGEEGRSRADYNNIGEDDAIGITGVSGSPSGLFYVGLSHVEEAGGQVVSAEIENPETGECVAPTAETVQAGDYAPLGRPLFVYASDTALERPEVEAFFQFYIDNQAEIAERALFIPMNEEQAERARRDVDGLVGNGSGQAGS